MLIRIAAIGFIFFCTALAWGILGGSIYSRTRSSSSDLHDKVASTWGSPQHQAAPSASYTQKIRQKTTTVVDGRKVEQEQEVATAIPLALESSRIDVALNLDRRQKGLLWYNTYRVNFAGAYRFRNQSAQEQLVRFTLPFPAEKAIYDGLHFSLDGQPLPVGNAKSSAQAEAPIAAGQAVLLQVSYKSRGLDAWGYDFGSDVAQVHDFTLLLRTNFKDIDFAENTLSPSSKRETENGWELHWTYQDLISGYQIAMLMPEPLQPGPLAGEISFFAPVSLFFFFFVLLILTTLRGIDLHPMNYFFLAAAFFAFHLLLAYLADHISIHLAFCMSSAVSVFLVVSYLRVVVGMRFAAVEAGLAQLVYLVLFSYAFFFKGYTGLAITAGAILTLFLTMQMTARVRWADVFARKPA